MIWTIKKCIDGGAPNRAVTVKTKPNRLYGGTSNKAMTVKTKSNRLYGGTSNDTMPIKTCYISASPEMHKGRTSRKKFIKN